MIDYFYRRAREWEVRSNTFRTFLHEIDYNWVKKDGKWTVGQIAAHLIQYHCLYFNLFDQILDGSYKAPPKARNIIYRTYYRVKYLRRSGPYNLKEYKTLPWLEPTKEEYSSQILVELEYNFKLLIQYLVALEETLSTKKTIIACPLNKHRVYTLKTAFAILISHSSRHILEISNIINACPSQLIKPIEMDPFLNGKL